MAVAAAIAADGVGVIAGLARLGVDGAIAAEVTDLQRGVTDGITAGLFLKKVSGAGEEGVALTAWLVSLAFIRSGYSYQNLTP